VIVLTLTDFPSWLRDKNLCFKWQCVSLDRWKTSIPSGCKCRAGRQFTGPRRRIFLCGNNTAVLMSVSVWIFVDLPCYWLLNDSFIRSDYSHTRIQKLALSTPWLLIVGV